MHFVTGCRIFCSRCLLCFTLVAVICFVFLFDVNRQISEVYSKELKGAVSNLASLQGHLLIASGPKITLHKWTGSELNGVAFYDAPLHVVSLNIVSAFLSMFDYIIYI